MGLVGVGIACIIAAIVGGGLRAFGVEFPALTTKGRQVLLAAFGLVLIMSGNTAPLESFISPYFHPHVTPVVPTVEASPSHIVKPPSLTDKPNTTATNRGDSASTGNDVSTDNLITDASPTKAEIDVSPGHTSCFITFKVTIIHHTSVNADSVGRLKSFLDCPTAIVAVGGGTAYNNTPINRITLNDTKSVADAFHRLLRAAIRTGFDIKGINIDNERVPAGELWLDYDPALDNSSLGTSDVGRLETGSWDYILDFISAHSHDSTPPPSHKSGAKNVLSLPAPSTLDLSSSIDAATHGDTSFPPTNCLGYKGGHWLLSASSITLDACVHMIFDGRCPRPGTVVYGRWGLFTLRSSPGRIDVSVNNKDFAPVAPQYPADCSIPEIGK